MVQKRHLVLWAKPHLKWTVSKWKSDLWSDKSKFDILVGNHGRRVLRAKEKGETFQRVLSVQFKSQHLWCYGGVYVHTVWDGMACFGRHYECWNVYKGFRATYAPLVYFSRTMQNHKLQLLRQLLSRSFTYREHGASLNEKCFKDDQELFSNWKPTKTPENHNLNAQTSSVFWIEEQMLHHGKHALVPTILRPVAGIRFEMSSFCAYNCNISQVKHTIPKHTNISWIWVVHFHQTKAVPLIVCRPESVCCCFTVWKKRGVYREDTKSWF